MQWEFWQVREFGLPIVLSGSLSTKALKTSIMARNKYFPHKSDAKRAKWLSLCSNSSTIALACNGMSNPKRLNTEGYNLNKWLAWASLAFLLYCASCPLVMVLFINTLGDVPSALFIFYTPVVWLYDNFPLFQEMLDFLKDLL